MTQAAALPLWIADFCQERQTLFGKLYRAVMGPLLPQADGSFCYNQCAKHWIIQTLMSSMQTFAHSLTAALPHSHKSIHYYR